MRRFASGLAVLVWGMLAVAYASDLIPADGEIVIRGIVTSTNLSAGEISVDAVAVRLAGEAQSTLLAQPTPKNLTFTGATPITLDSGSAGSPNDIVQGVEIAAAGPNLGRGKPLPARAIVIYPPSAAPVTAPGTGANQAPGQPPDTAPAEGRTSPVSQQWALWDDPAGLRYQHPMGWTPSATKGANPVTFQQGPLALYVRRLPVDPGTNASARAAVALAATRSTASDRGWRASESRSMIGGAPSTVLSVRGEFSPRDFAKLLGAKADAIQQLGPGVVYLGYVATPANAGREEWALEIGVGGPQSKVREITSIFTHVTQGLTWGRREVREPPTYNSPLRAANVVQIENTLKQVGTAIQLYFVDVDEVVPPNWEALAPYLGGSTALLKNLNEGWPAWQVGPVQLLQPGKRISGLGNPSAVPVAKVDGPGFSVAVYADGHVQRIRAQ